MILRNRNVSQVKKFLMSKLESNHGNANILIIFTILVEEGIEYLRQIRQEMYDFLVNEFISCMPLQPTFGLNSAKHRSD